MGHFSLIYSFIHLFVHSISLKQCELIDIYVQFGAITQYYFILFLSFFGFGQWNSSVGCFISLNDP